MVIRRQFLAGLGAAMFAADSPFEPEIDANYSERGFLVSEMVDWLAGSGRFFPVWLRRDRITSSPNDGTPGIAAWLNYLPSGRMALRVLDARSGRVVFTSELPEMTLREELAEVGRWQFDHSHRSTITCPEKPRGFFTLYRASGDAPYEAYFDHRPVRFQQAVCYRNYLRRSPDEALVIQALNPDFIQWFRQRVAGIPELPEPEAMCGEEGELWTRLWNTYR